MDSTPSPKSAEPEDALVARADERLAHAYGQIARADEQLARVTEQLTKLERDAARQPFTPPSRRPSRGRPALRGFIGLLLAACIFGTAFAWQSAYGDAAKLTLARWAPQLLSLLPQEKPAPGAQASSPTAQMVAVASADAQPALSAQAAPQDAAPIAASMPPELTQSLETLERHLTNVEQAIEQLKASQDQMASDNAKAIEELKAGQEQMTRLVAKASEPNPRSRTAAAPPRPVAAPARQLPQQASPQARAQP